MPSPKIIAAIVVAAALATGQVPGVPAVIGGTADDAADAGPPPPEVVDVEHATPAGPDDGYLRLIVTPTGGPDDIAAAHSPAPTPTPTAAPTATPAPTPQPDETESDGSTSAGVQRDEPSDTAVDDAPSGEEIDPDEIDAATLEQLTAGAELVIDDEGRPWAEYPDGVRVPLWRGGTPEVPTALVEPTPTDAGAADPDPPREPLVPDGPDVALAVDPPEDLAMVAAPAEGVGHPLMDLVATLDEVADVVSIGDGTYAVTLVNPAVLDGLPLEFVDDVPMGIATDTLETYQWALDNTADNLVGVTETPPTQVADADLDVPKAAAAASGAGIVVAVVDTGIDFSHPDLSHAAWSNPLEECGNGIDDDANGYVDDCAGWNFATDDNVTFGSDSHGHGTHVAGIIAAARNGVGVAGIAPKAQLMDLAVATTNENGEPGVTLSAVARAVRYAVDNGAHVVNISLATGAGVTADDVEVLERAIAHAAENGVLVVAAAGNAGENVAVAGIWPAASRQANVITVGASDPSDGPAQFSNWGDGVDIFAPGELIVSTAPESAGSYLFRSGTSQAAPAVAAVAALVLDRTPGLAPADMKDKLVGSADRNDALAGHVANGVRLNAANAVGKGKPTFSIDEVRVTMTGLAGASAGADIHIGFDVAVPTDHFVDPYRWEAGLFTTIGDGAFAVVDHPVSVDGIDDATDGQGILPLPIEATGGQTSWSTRLPEGSYQLVLEAVPLDDPTRRLGDALVTSFTVTTGTGQAPAVLAMVDTEADDASDGSDPGEVAVPDPVAAAGWSIESIAPHQGELGRGTTVQLLGTFPDQPYVWFGEVPGSVLSWTESELVVVAPDQAEPGAVDVSLRHPTITPLTMAAGFTYTPADQSSAPAEDEKATAGAVAAPSPSGAGDTRSATDDPGDPATEPQNERQPRTKLGQAFVLDSGVGGSRILGNDPRAEAPACSADPCVLS